MDGSRRERASALTCTAASHELTRDGVSVFRLSFGELRGVGDFSVPDRKTPVPGTGVRAAPMRVLLPHSRKRTARI